MKPILAILLLASNLASAQVCSGNRCLIDAPKYDNQQESYHGRLTENPYAPDSTSNPYGRYGNPLSPESINNPLGAGNPLRQDSPGNPLGRGMELYGE